MPRGVRRHYDAKIRGRTVGIALIEGVTETERKTGIPKNTIQYWLNRPEFVQLRTSARNDVTEQMWAAAQETLAAMVQALADAPLRERAQAFDTIMEHYALLTGGATVRSETRDLAEGLEDHEKLALRDAIDAWLAQPEVMDG